MADKPPRNPVNERLALSLKAEVSPPLRARIAMQERATNKAEFFVTPGYGGRQLKMFHYSQAAKVGNRVETSGQGPWDNDWHFPEKLADEITQAFRNLERT